MLLQVQHFIYAKLRPIFMGHSGGVCLCSLHIWNQHWVNLEDAQLLNWKKGTHNCSVLF